MYEINDPERIKLNAQIRDWNANRLDLFQISEPNDFLEFYGVMRFFYQGDDLKYQTKCLRVSSTASTKDVVDALNFKFHPDSKTMNNDKYTLYETHSLEERRMKNSEHPLIVQLNWALDDKDGKFILKNESRRRRSTDLTNHALLSNYGMSRSTCTLTNGYDNQPVRTQSTVIYNTPANFFSRRSSNSKKSKKNKAEKDAFQNAEEAKRLAEEISGKPPESSFTRTISNPDDVMKRRRQKKLEFRLEQFSGVKGDGETGGTLKIYGDSINPEIPYKTLLLSVNDTAEKVLEETLDKYGLSYEEHKFYILVQQNIPPRDDRNRSNIQEIILHKQDCPLGILVQCPPKRGFAIFSVRKATKHDKLPISARMPPFAMTKEVSTISNIKSKSTNSERQVSSSLTIESDEYSDIIVEYPRLRKLNMDDNGSFYDADNGMFSLATLINNQSKKIMLIDSLKSIKVGSQASSVGSYPNILLPLEYYSDIRPIHCNICSKLDPESNTMKFQLTPSLDSSSRTPRPCIIFINQRKIDRTTKINNGDIIQLGDSVILRFEEFNDYESINTYTIDDTEQSSESLEVHNYTNDLPITIKYNYKNGENIVDNIITFSKNYAEEGSKELFSSIIKSDNEKLDDKFTLSTAYMLYLVMRAGLFNEDKVVKFINLIADRLDKIIQEDQNIVEKEIFWLSNCSELLHLLQYDSDLRHYSVAAQDVLVISIERVFSIIQEQFTQDLMILLPAILNEDDSDIADNTQEDNTPCLDRASILTESNGIDFPIQHLLQTLSFAFNLFQNCQVNVALTIQMFSQLFHLLNTWLFNKILGEEIHDDDTEIYPILICQEWGNRLMRRLNRIKYWSEINGLDMAANCHLQKIYQVAELMEADKRDLSLFGEKCLEMVNLNGIQLHHLLINCQDYDLPNAWIEVVVNTAIQLHNQDFNDGRSPKEDSKNKLPLYEDMQLRLPLLLPADGYCCDRGIVSCPSDIKLMLASMNDLLKYRINPPVTEEIDARWKVFLNMYENTPTVSRSNTIEQLSPTQSKSDVIYIPKNVLIDSLESEEVSVSETESTPKERYQKKPFIKSQNHSKTTDNSSIINNQSSLQVNAQDDDYSSINSVNSTDGFFELKLTKIENSLGLSIIAAKATSSDTFRIYVKDVIVGGSGFKSGKIFSGDQIVSIDGNPLIDMNQDEAVVFMKKTKSQVVLLINKSAALKHGVMDVINQAKNNKINQSSQKLQRLSNIQAPLIKPPPSKPVILPKSNVLNEDFDNKITEPPASNNKKYQKAQPTIIYRKISDSDEIGPDYNSLPVRKHNSSQGLSSGVVPIYATVKNEPAKNKVKDNTYNSLQNVSSKSNSHPNLNIYPKSKKLSEISSSESSSSGSMSSSDDESLQSEPKIENNQKRNSTSVYDRLSQNQSKPIIKVPFKATSELNIQSKYVSIPKHEVTPSATELRPNIINKTLISKPSEKYTDSSISTFHDEDEPLSLNEAVLLDQSLSSESETISSNTESTSSNQSQQPQKKISSEPVQLPIYCTTKIEDFDWLSKKSDPLPQRKSPGGALHLGGFKKPIKLTETKGSNQLPNLLKKSLPNSTQTTLASDNYNNTDEDTSYLPSSKVNVPAAPFLQYRPPNDLEEYDWTNGNNFNSPKSLDVEKTKAQKNVAYNPPITLIEKKTKLQSSTISANTNNEMKENEKKSNISDVEPHVSPGGRPNIKYGRPQFNEQNTSARPLSLFKPETNNHSYSSVGDFNIPSPPSMVQEGLVVPPSPIIKSKIYEILTNKPSEVNNHQDDVDELSFKEKMKLFASKIGEDNVIERKKIGGRQRRLESGDYS